MGRIRSSTPCTISMGTSIFGTSSRKSVSQVSTHRSVPIAEALSA
jgi:hypothetical protein